MAHVSYEDLLKPGYYEEKQKPRVEGQARSHHSNTTESAVELATWLAENGIQSLVSPKTPSTAAVVQITIYEGDSQIVWPSDWVLLEDKGENGIFPRILKLNEIAFDYKRVGE